MSMTVGELRQKLAIYEDDTTVMVQGPNDVDYWPMAGWLGESEDGEIVFIPAERRSSHATEKK